MEKKKQNFKQELLKEMARKSTTTPEENEDMATKKSDEKPFVPSAAGMKQTIELFESIFDNMHNRKEFDQYHGVLLSSSPGTGKCLEKDTELEIMVNEELYEILQKYK